MNHLASMPYLSSVVSIGDVPLGGTHPVRVQTMTNTPTMDTRATVEQCLVCAAAGAEYIRITAPGVREAEHLEVIKKELHHRGCRVPLIADIHFLPSAAEAAARRVEKVRINPGNYVDKKATAAAGKRSSSLYDTELERIHQRLLPLIRVCRQYGTAIRIGSNHGSLSERIVERYGDTPLGMAESAMEFLRIFRAEGFDHIVLSMKSSNVRVMVESTRLLVQLMTQEGMAFPLHLGVTEAGEGSEGRIKSAAGIGALLAEGLGDTIRVSLTEAPEAELPVARQIVRWLQGFRAAQVPQESGYSLTEVRGEWEAHEEKNFFWNKESFRLHGAPALLLESRTTPGIAGFRQGLHALPGISQETAQHPPLQTETDTPLGTEPGTPQRTEPALPVILRKKYSNTPLDILQIQAACDFGPIFIDQLAQGLWIEGDGLGCHQKSLKETALTLLQACRERASKAEFISCPSCGRTLFDLQQTAAAIRARTGHLKGLRIGIMGCIVNGPGEMADAHYGYVGSGPGRITLYKGREVVRKNIPAAQAVDELIELIKSNGDWVAPPDNME